MSPAKGSSFRQFRDMNPVPIGIVSIIVLIGMIVLALNISKLPFTSGRSYSAAFTEAAGLRSGDQVQIGGVAVGKVGSVSLEGTHVKVAFRVTNSDVHLGQGTKASIQIATLLGNKYVALEPAGTGELPESTEIPISRTASPYDVEPALQGLASTAGRIKSRQLAGALNSISAAFRNSPAPLRSTLSGLSRLSQTIASRDAALSSLLQHTANLSGVLAQRRQQFTQILGDGSKLLTMLDRRRQVIDQLLVNTQRLATQLTGMVHDNQRTLTPMLNHLHGVLALLNRNQDNLTKIIQELYLFVRGEVDATGSGPWFDGTAINVLNPISPGKGLLNGQPSAPAKSLNQLLGVAGSSGSGQ